MIALLVHMQINELQRLPCSERTARHEQQLRALIEIYDWINEQMAAGNDLLFFSEDSPTPLHTLETLTRAFQDVVIKRFQKHHAKTQEKEQT